MHSHTHAHACTHTRLRSHSHIHACMHTHTHTRQPGAGHGATGACSSGHVPAMQPWNRSPLCHSAKLPDGVPRADADPGKAPFQRLLRSGTCSKGSAQGRAQEAPAGPSVSPRGGRTELAGWLAMLPSGITINHSQEAPRWVRTQGTCCQRPVQSLQGQCGSGGGSAGTWRGHPAAPFEPSPGLCKRLVLAVAAQGAGAGWGAGGRG